MRQRPQPLSGSPGEGGAIDDFTFFLLGREKLSRLPPGWSRERFREAK
jgi:hypothetical protein